MEKKKVYIGFIAYNDYTAKYLPYFLPSLRRQNYENIRIIALDNSATEHQDNARYIRERHPEIKYDSTGGINLGFGRGFNRMINQARREGADYFLALNPDMIIEPDLVEKLAAALDQDDKIGAAAPMIMKWDFNAVSDPEASGLEAGDSWRGSKTDIIDSCGLKITREHSFFDAEQGSRCHTGPDNEEIFGFTGAAVMFNLHALRDVAFHPGNISGIKADGDLAEAGNETEEYFDELMFMYKEDCDLSYRLRLAGWKIVLASKAVAYHDRTAANKGENIWQVAFNRKNKSRQVKKWSYLNHLILLCKIRHLPFSAPVRAATIWYQIKSLVFILLFEQFLLNDLFVLWKLRNVISQKRKQMIVRADMGQIERFMDK